MQHSNFVHLHVHTEYSLLDGAIRLEELFQKASKLRMPAIAMTDHGNMFGTVDFYQKAYASGVKPIIGCELYVARKSRLIKDSSSENDRPHHLAVLAKNSEGYHNLVKLTSTSYLDGFYYKPRVDKDILAECSGGLIGMSACLSGEIPSLILQGRTDEARTVASFYRELFGDGNFYLELMENGIPDQDIVNKEILRISQELSIPPVATNDCHYLNRDDSEAHEILLCIQTGKTIADNDRMRMPTDEFYLKTPEEMTERFSYCPEAIRNTLEIADKCNVSIDLSQTFLPQYEIRNDTTPDEHLKKIAEEGLQYRLSTMSDKLADQTRKVYEERLASELEIIESMGFPGYFLIVSDFVNYAKKRKIPVGPGRGSAAGSLVAYALGITNIDPIRYRLFFERFLNPARKSMPDIDIDFCMEGREEIIRYVTEKYGHDHVAQIITFGKMQAKAVVRDVGRALNMSYADVDQIAKMIPNVLGIKLNDAIKRESRLREESAKNNMVEKLLTLSQRLEGLNRHASTHAAGVVISDIPLVQRVPLYKSPNDDSLITQYSMNDLQTVGLTKFDFLGLRTLTVLNHALTFIREGRGVDIDLETLPLDDQKAFQLLSKGHTNGVFQLESAGMKDILHSMKPDCMEDIIALIALYRPGPMSMVPDFIARKQGRSQFNYVVPELENILQETYGVILYQEQVMQIASTIGNYSMAEADNLRRAMSKKKKDVMAKEKPKFIAGAKKNHISESKSQRIWENMETFAEYGFNKSHSTAYAIISYQTAYLKAHYPVEFMAALLTSEKNNRDNIIKYIGECRDMEIAVLPPDINESERDFSVSGESVRFGLAAVKNVGEGAVDSIIDIRRTDGQFTSFFDFLTRVDLRKINKKVIESLIKCGAFDTLEKNRRSLFEGLENAVDIAQRRFRERMNGQTNLFDAPELSVEIYEPPLPDIDEWDREELLSYEKDTLGFYVTGHPLLNYSDILHTITNTSSDTILDMPDGSIVSVAGIVSAIREVSTKRKEIMAYVTLDDMKGTLSVIVFPDLYRDSLFTIQGDEPLFVKGKLDASEEGSKIIAQEISPLDDASQKPLSSVHLRIKSAVDNDNLLNDLKSIIIQNKGNYPIFLHIIGNKTDTIVSLGGRYRVDISESFLKDADMILGPGSTQLQ